VGTGLAFAGQTYVEEGEHVVPDIINDPIPVGDGARDLPVHAVVYKVIKDNIYKNKMDQT
jgi:hypothetical protein